MGMLLARRFVASHRAARKWWLPILGRKTSRADEFLDNVHMHFGYSSWLNQVELWFATIERDVIAVGINDQRSAQKTRPLHPPPAREFT